MADSRAPAASGTFYPALPARLRSDVRGFLAGARRTPGRAAALLAPHAGYAYCGPVLGAAFAAADIPAVCIVLAPIHAPPGVARDSGAVLLERPYRTPLGEVPPDAALGREIVARTGDALREDAAAHEREHGVEVLLPFLQLRNPAVRLVPIVFGWDDWPRTRALAAAIHDATAARDDVLVVASSDMTHFEPASIATDRDTLALDRVITADAEGLLRTVADHGVSMCGPFPVACALEVARLRGRVAGEVVGYSHSGLADGNTERVVGYAAALIGLG